MSDSAPEPMGPSGEAVRVDRAPEDVPVHRSSWGVAAALAVAVLCVGVADGFSIVALPLGALLLAYPENRRGWWFGLAVVVWALAFTSGGGALASAGRGWPLLLAASLLGVSLARPQWRAFPRVLAAVAAAFFVVGVALALTRSWSSVDAAVAAQFEGMAPLAHAELALRFPDSALAADFAAVVERTLGLWAMLFPGLLALQSLAALTLVLWAFRRSRVGGEYVQPLGPLREFRFHDSLIWVLVVGLVLIVLPAGAETARAGYNLLLFMGALYALRGVAVFVFIGRGAVSVTSVVFGTLAVVLFYQLVLTAAVLVGLGDTWLDVRARAAAASRS